MFKFCIICYILLFAQALTSFEICFFLCFPAMLVNNKMNVKIKDLFNEIFIIHPGLLIFMNKILKGNF